MTAHRARSEEAKADRRRAIVDAAGAVFDEVGIDGFTMDEVAARVELSKAALYRYFATRESLLLALSILELGDFFDRVDHRLAGPRRPARDPSGLCAAWLCDAALASPRLIRLQGVTSSILEHNISVETAFEFKSWLMDRCVASGAGLAVRCGAPPAAGVRFLIHFQLLVVGLDSHLHPARAVAVALEAPELAAFRLDAPVELLHAARALAHATLGYDGTRSSTNTRPTRTRRD